MSYIFPDERKYPILKEWSRKNHAGDNCSECIHMRQVHTALWHWCCQLAAKETGLPLLECHLDEDCTRCDRFTPKQRLRKRKK